MNVRLHDLCLYVQRVEDSLRKIIPTDSESILSEGLEYLSGNSGCQSVKVGLSQIEMSVSRGHVDSQIYLSNFLANGTFGATDCEKAIHYSELSCKG